MEELYSIFTSKLSKNTHIPLKDYEDVPFGRNIGAMMSAAPCMQKRQMSYL